MRVKNNITRTCAALGILGVLATNSACDQGDPRTLSAAAQDDFIQLVEDSYREMKAGQIKKKAGFFGECSVDFGMENGIRYSKTVCDAGKDSLKVTIRVTDPSSRPPSQQNKSIALTLDEGKKKNVARGKTEQLQNGITLHLDRSGQSVEMTGIVPSTP